MIAKRLFFSKILFYFFQYGTGRILKFFQFWGSYKFPLDLQLHLILVLYGWCYLLRCATVHDFYSMCFKTKKTICFLYVLRLKQLIIIGFMRKYIWAFYKIFGDLSYSCMQGKHSFLDLGYVPTGSYLQMANLMS